MIFERKFNRFDNILNFHDVNFWRFYQNFEQLTLEQYKSIGFSLNCDEENNLLPHVIDFGCDDKYSLEIKIFPHRYGEETLVENWMVYLSLICQSEKKSITLGWWDEAQWHPFCLRWSELNVLSEHIAKKNSSISINIVFLLLCRFTGISVMEFADENEWENRKIRVKEAYQSLGMKGEESEKLIVNTIFLKEDYQWIYNEKTGWEFSGDYPCYSIRNNAHFGKENENFPYKWFNEMMTNIEHTT